MITPSDLRSLSREQLIALVDDVPWYHTIDLGDGIVTKGTYDLRPVLDQYGFPADLRGKRVLDIGRASGFFSFELERRGAEVTSTELGSLLDKDYVGGDLVRDVIRRRAWTDGVPPIDPEYGDRLDFGLAHLILGSRVKSVSVRLAEISPETVPGAPFDLVFVGSVLNHVQDPIAALQRIASVTGDLCIIANPVDPDDASPIPRARLVGRSGTGLTTWFLPNLACLEEMVCSAGFDDVKVTTPALDLPRPGTKPIRHAVVQARAVRDRAAATARWADWLDHGSARLAEAQAKIIAAERGKKRRPRLLRRIAAKLGLS